jgi:hypothetical protein
MARPRKDGMDYFPHDVHMSTDKKVKALRIMYGNDGYTFFNIALEMIYQEPNFELDVSDAETIQILASNVEVTVQKLSEMIATAVKHGCFDKERYTNDGVLTSNGILKRADVVTKKRVSMREKYDKKVSDEETTPETPQSKRKVKVKEVKNHYAQNITLTEDEHRKLCGEYGDIMTQAIISYLDSYKVEKAYKTKSDYLTIKRWVVDAVKKMPNNVRQFVKPSEEYVPTIAEFKEQERLKQEAMMQRAAEI